MIDRAARDGLAELLVQFSEGRVAAEELPERVPESRDPAIAAIGAAAESLLYDTDIDSSGFAQLSWEQKEEMRRCVLFLRSGLPYRWDQPTNLPWWTVLLAPFVLALAIVLMVVMFLGAEALSEALGRMGWKVEEADLFFPIVMAGAGIAAAGCWLAGRRRGVDRAVWPFHLRSEQQQADGMARPSAQG